MTTLTILARGLGANWLGCYGNEWVATPNLDRLAAEGTVFDQHFATDLQPPQFLGEVIAVKRLKDAIAKVKPGVGTVIDCGELLPPWTVKAEVFETYCEDADEPLTPLTVPEAGEFDRDDEIAWDRLHLSFAAAVTLFDAAVGKLLDAIDLDSTTVIVTSDAGFPLGEHGVVGREDSQLHEELVHLPLIVRWPNGVRAGERVMSLTTPADWNGIQNGNIPQHDRVASAINNGRAVRTAEWTLLQRGEDVRLFRRPEDKWEVNDVAREYADVVAELASVEA